MDLKDLNIKKTQEAIKNGEFSVRELVSAYQENIKNKNGDVNAYLEIFDDAFEIAEKQDEEILAGQEMKPLTGIPFAIKDNILIKGKIASAGSKILENYHATYDATVVEKLRDAGAIFLGRTNMDEFAMGASTESSAFGATKNPLGLSRVAGGSSGGSAAAVAMNGCLASLGSDTAGSVRQPASFCGAVGLKLTYGAVSRYGLIALGSSFDQIGPITKTVEDAETIFNVIKGKDNHDSTSVEDGELKVESGKKFKIGLLKYDKNGVDKEINETMEKTVADLKKLGHEIKEVELPHLEYAVPCYYIIMFAEASSNLSRFDGVRYGFSKKGNNLLEDYMKTRGEGFGEETRRRIMLGTYVLSAGYYDAYYQKAQKVRALIRKDFRKVFEKFDLILSPTFSTPAFKIGEKTQDPLQMYLGDTFTAPANLAGIPAISLPVAKSSEGLPIGAQFMAPWFREDLLFAVGKQLT